MIENLTAQHIGGQSPGEFELQRQNNGLLYIVGLDGNNDNAITLALSSFPIPKVNSEIIEVDYLNEKRKFPGKPTFDDLSVILRDYVDRDIAGILHRWRKQAWDWETGKIGRVANLKKQARIELFAPDGTEVREYELHGVWPSAVDGGEIDMASSEGVQITVTLTYDRFIPRFV
tara:strand:- start:3937 stop:4458 length:522 start_codon:yes stop_codon:yes gene_type:complete